MNVYSTPQYDDFTGFTFNGQHSSQFGLLRVSNGDRYEDTLVLSSSDEAADIPGGPGQYYWGETLKPRTFPIKIAYDNITEVDKRRIKHWLHPDDKLHELIFDERPYVKYWVKCTKEVKTSELCFRGNHNPNNLNKSSQYRIYKGEFDIEFTAYMPYGVAVGKTLSDIKRTYSDNSMDSISEWDGASGILSREAFDNRKIDIFDGNVCKIYNPGDIETGFELNFNLKEERIALTLPEGGGVSGNNGSTSYTKINNKIDSVNNKVINYSGIFYSLQNINFPEVSFTDSNNNKHKGQIIDEGNVSKFESIENGQIYDIYLKSTSKQFFLSYWTKDEIDFSKNYSVYALDANNNYYEIYILSITPAGNGNTIVIDFTDTTITTSGVYPKKLYIPKSTNSNMIVHQKIIPNQSLTTGLVQANWNDSTKIGWYWLNNVHYPDYIKEGLSIVIDSKTNKEYIVDIKPYHSEPDESNINGGTSIRVQYLDTKITWTTVPKQIKFVSNNDNLSFSLEIPGFATIKPTEWTEAQKALFYSSTIKIDTNKKTINYKIQDNDFNINTEWKGISSIINNGSLFKIQPEELYVPSEQKIVITTDTMSISNPTINYTYLYK